MEDSANYEKIRHDTQVFFHSLKPIHSPALNELVHFSAESFNHIIYKSSRNERDRSSQVMRFKLLQRAVKLISLSTTYQEYEESIKVFDVKSENRKRCATGEKLRLSTIEKLR